MTVTAKVSRLTIREALESDLELIVDFNVALALESENLVLDRATVSRGVKRVFSEGPCNQYYIAELDGRAVGQTLLLREVTDWRDGYYYWIHSVYVLPDARGQGIFRALFDHVVARAKANGDARMIKLYVDKTNHKAIKVYEALGMSSGHYHLYELEV